ncbi:Hypothetical predicted protein [Pelobates cultripes]|uniref:Uncharacterized protein n=1 Tax=Pelobates cultripes TaxID=61616 RepID=A0AAD1W3E0_PELCU|nr:Hypothetical predicted protein [Pelobates cultripes]
MADGHTGLNLPEPPTITAPHVSLEQWLNKLFLRFWAQPEARIKPTRAQNRGSHQRGKERLAQP